MVGTPSSPAPDMFGYLTGRHHLGASLSAPANSAVSHRIGSGRRACRLPFMGTRCWWVLTCCPHLRDVIMLLECAEAAMSSDEED